MVSARRTYYDVALKQENMAGFLDHPGFTFRQEDLQTIDAVELLAGSGTHVAHCPVVFARRGEAVRYSVELAYR